jgi:hypothetical protein
MVATNSSLSIPASTFVVVYVRPASLQAQSRLFGCLGVWSFSSHHVIMCTFTVNNTRTSLHLQENVQARAVPPIVLAMDAAVRLPTPQFPALVIGCVPFPPAALMVMATVFFRPHLCSPRPKVGDSDARVPSECDHLAHIMCM